MKNQKKFSLSQFFLSLGILLLIAAVVLMIAWQWNIHTAAQKAETYVHTLRTVMPAPQGAVAQPRSNNAMPALSLNGTDFVGILEMPHFDSVLPVGADWGDSSKFPSRFDGSIYDGSIQIGATSQKGQYDFYRQIAVGDPVFFTDMEGNRYSYIITDLRYEQHADQAALQRKNASLTLFIKNIYALEYIIVYCDAA
jgi:sortase A